ncbi:MULTISPECIES: NmrA family NAD(P)-binding protein [unclassified Bosea (in: a-proteobacteria)]|uniref:NmrA family NAD(P)-binding protein n=1 Tax=unclassified Bosea (in: a-proteobacteria) TaxID=2653178 RepID=UPI000F75A90E|nr:MULTISPECIES: NmrA family NAD(P)-binding protein [unclassified Bosea (in: a-proteobacteria)]AZO81924.1 epimerase [Bosea sp. Tri-49]RXT16847.1 epimerase [Bosea sp. Tri-39]RXT37751.1 epimerase [Bosea sp. Tri-54]
MTAEIDTVLAVGAHGRFAGFVPPALRGKGIKIRALVRDDAAAAAALGNGATELARGDLRNPDTLLAAVRGVQGVFHIGPAFAPDEAEMGLNMVRVARQEGVAKFVYSSVIQPTYARLPNHASKIVVEQALFESGLDYTILRPTNVFQNLVAAWPAIVETATFAEPFPATMRVARVDYRDVAEAAAIAFSSNRLSYGAFDLCADGSPNRDEIVALMSHVLGRPIAAAEPNFDTWAAKASLPYAPAQIEVLRQVHAHYATHGAPGNGLVLRAILGREPRTLQAFIQELATGQSLTGPDAQPMTARS